MSFSKTLSAQVHLLSAYIIDVEVDISRGFNSFSIVGLPNKAVEESKDRVSASVKNSGFKSPKSLNHKIIVSLAPADLKKEGPNFDVAIALSYLLAVGDIIFDPSNKLFLGELSLDGNLRPIKGALPLVLEAKRRGIKEVYLPIANTSEVSIVSGITIFGITNLSEIIEHLSEKNKKKTLLPVWVTQLSYRQKNIEVDFKDIKGQEEARRALEIAASGGHNIMLYGPPGTGKTMLARAFQHLLPRLSFEEILEVTSIHSSVGLSSRLISSPPFRSPHHLSSYISLVGGGSSPRPGEVTLAHRGVLFMDEFPEFDMRVIESLRQPLEDRSISITRSRSSVIFPADFILIGAMNPCPCGHYGSKQKECLCTENNIINYQKKVSGPIADRIDLWISVNNIDYEKLGRVGDVDSTEIIRIRVEKARQIQKKRFEKNTLKIYTNSRMSADNILNYCPLKNDLRLLLENSAKKLSLSARVYHRIIKIARTIADLEDVREIEERHILEALQYRPKLKTLSG